MTSRPDQLDPSSAARRRLVRGAFASPAVLALYSGSAFAMASNLRCVNNQVQAGSQTFPAPVASPDGFVRVQLYSLTNDGVTSYYLSGNDLDALRMDRSSVGNTFLQPGEWWQFDPLKQELVGVKGDQPLGNLSQDGPWVAVRIDASDTAAGIVGVVDGSDTGSAVSGLCWSSFVTSAA